MGPSDVDFVNTLSPTHSMPTPPVHTGPVTTDQAAADRAASLRSLARVLDSAIGIPGTRIRLGLDSIIGLVPGVGDLAGAALSGYIVLAAARLGVPTSVIIRMVINVAIDALVGAVPLLGDLFDVGWKANTKNTALIDRYLTAPAATKKGSLGVILGVVLVLILLAAAAFALTVGAVKLIGTAIGF